MARAGESTRAKNLLTYGILIVFGVTLLGPFLWTVSTSLKSKSATFDYPPKLLPSTDEHWSRVPARAGDEVGEVDVRVRPLRTGISPAFGLIGGGALGAASASGTGETVTRAKIVEEGDRRGEIVHVPDSWIREETRLDIHWENYPESWSAYPFVSFGRAYLNSIVVALLVTLGQVITSTLAAYAFARLKFPGRDLLFFGYLATMMVPGAVTMIPTFALLKNMPDAFNYLLGTDYFSRELVFGGKVLGIDSYFALIVPRTFSAYGTFMLRQFFLSVPKDLEDAARIDGCGSFGILRHVILPLSTPALATLAIFTFLWAWGDFLWPLVVVNSDEIKPLPLLLTSFQGQHGTQWNYMMAASVTALVPMVAIFVIGQRYFIEGIKLGAVKG